MSTEHPIKSTPIFDAVVDRGIMDPEVLASETTNLGTADADAPLPAAPALADPPDAAARDAARRGAAAQVDDTLRDADFRFITRGVSPSERAAVIAVLTQVRAEETRRRRSVERREHQPWARSQRVPEGISDLLAEG